MQTKLTLRMDDELVEAAKAEAGRRGKSVSRMVGEFFGSLSASPRADERHPPVTASLIGILKGREVSEKDYRRHLRARHL